MYRRKSSLIWTIIGFISIVLIVYLLSKHSHLISLLLNKSGIFGPVVALALYPIFATTPLTTDPITIVIAVIYGPFAGFTLSMIGNAMAALVEYYVGIKIGKATNYEAIKHKLPFGLGKLPVNSIPFLIFGRMIPLYGSKVLSILAGMHRVPMRRYIWTSIVTNIPGSIILSYGGFHLVRLVKFLRQLTH